MKTIGIIAGNGRFPFLAAGKALKEGYKVVVCGIEKEADPSLETIASAFQWGKIGQLKKMKSFFQDQGVSEAIMAGKIEKIRLFQENVSPDFDMMKVIMKVRDFKDDSLLGAIAAYLSEAGIILQDSTLFSKDDMPPAGVLGKKKPSEEMMEDIRFGFNMAKSIAGLDIGQTVIVKKKAVLAVEAIEGTDEAIRRGSALGREGIIVVKVSKPGQDMRFDVPAVGLRTMEELITAKAKAFAFEASMTLFLEKEKVVEAADRHGIVLIGINGENLNGT